MRQKCRVVGVRLYNNRKLYLLKPIEEEGEMPLIHLTVEIFYPRNLELLEEVWIAAYTEEDTK